MPRKRGAVVIGVNKTGNLPTLEASASGAQKFAAWLEGEGFEVTLLTDDEKKSVTAAQILDAVKAFVAPGTYDQLVVYFTGHGYAKNDAELWLLTGAPQNPNEAVNWKETVDLAKDCGIPNVVLISDACRSLPNSVQADRVRGSIIFPNDGPKIERAKVDKFLAAAPGTAAYELVLVKDGKKENVFTHCLLRAFEAPDADMVSSVKEDDTTISIVPNRKLGPYLKREVPELLAKVSITLDQLPDDEVLSDERAYIGRAGTKRAADLPPPADIPLASAVWRRMRNLVTGGPTPVIDVRKVAASAFADALNVPIEAIDVRKDVPLQRTGIRKFDDAATRASTEAPSADERIFSTGFAILGIRMRDVATLKDTRAEILADGDGRGEPGLISIVSDHATGTIAVRFENGSGVALAALAGYIGHVVVDDGKVVSINYVPSEASPRFGLFAERRAQLHRLRAAAAAAMRFGVFRVDDPIAANRLAGAIRVDKSIDPSLGLYAAYAYAEADRRDELDQVAWYMNTDLDIELFDVAMLARRRRDDAFDAAEWWRTTVPFCPMLTQGWNLLRARGIRLPEVLEDAQDELHAAVWTTFRPERMGKIFDAIGSGDLERYFMRSKSEN